jgi:hypothetical protein
MRRHYLALVGTVAAVMVVLLAAVLVSGQAPAADATPKGPAIRTPWGEPDLQGIWSHNVDIPLERPRQYAGKEFLTDQEMAARDAARVAAAGRPRGEKGSERDVAGAYNGVFNSLRKTGRRTSLIVDPPDGQIPALTPEAQKKAAAVREYLIMLLQGSSGGKGGKTVQPSPLRRTAMPPIYNTVRTNRADGIEDRGLGERCLEPNLPTFTGQESFYRIVQSPGYVTMYYEARQGGGNRIIPVDGSAHLPARIRRYWGDSRGRWEGDTLVVDTTNFSPKSEYQGSRENRHLVERFRRVAADTLEYRVTIEDPTTWVRPWTVEVSWTKNDDRANRIFESACHEGNYGIVGILANTRAAETAFKEGRGADPDTMDIATPGGGRNVANSDE